MVTPLKQIIEDNVTVLGEENTSFASSNLTWQGREKALQRCGVGGENSNELSKSEVCAGLKLVSKNREKVSR